MYLLYAKLKFCRPLTSGGFTDLCTGHIGDCLGRQISRGGKFLDVFWLINTKLKFTFLFNLYNDNDQLIFQWPVTTSLPNYNVLNWYNSFCYTKAFYKISFFKKRKCVGNPITLFWTSEFSQWKIRVLPNYRSTWKIHSIFSFCLFSSSNKLFWRRRRIKNFKRGKI